MSTVPQQSFSTLSDRVALVTGASRGIGRATAEALASAGATIAIHYRTNALAAEKLAASLVAAGRPARTYAADFRDPSSAEALVSAVCADYGRIDMLVNNAGSLKIQNTEEASLADWNDMVATNLTTPFLLAQAAFKAMKPRGSGAIVNVASIAGVNGGNMGPAYAATKGGLIALTRYLARDCIRFGIRVNCVAPTLTDTDLVKQPAMDALRARILAANPMGRLAEPREVAKVIQFLCSDDASFVNGDCVMVTGGP